MNRRVGPILVKVGDERDNKGEPQEGDKEGVNRGKRVTLCVGNFGVKQHTKKECPNPKKKNKGAEV